jgi:precorrin-2/cobalt-factor-2 C20-methyltransferase
LVELTGVGVGPGSPGLLTLEAFRVLSEVDHIYAPASGKGSRSLAAQIVCGAGIPKGKLRELSFPMTRDEEALREAWSQAARPVVQELYTGKRAAFITLGDPSVYSTWIYFRRAVEKLRPETEITVLPGIMTANAAAARLGIPLVEGDERMALLPLPDPVEKLDAYLPLVDRLVIYKIGSRLGELARWSSSRGLDRDARLVIGVGLEREQAGYLQKLASAAEGYLSVAFIHSCSVREGA